VLGTISYGTASLPVAIKVTKAASSHAAASTVNSSSTIQPIRLFKDLAGLMLLACFLLVAEVAVYALAGAAIDLLAKAHHASILPRHYSDEASGPAVDQGEDMAAASTNTSR